MAPNFAALLKKKAGEVKRPEPLPQGDYPAIIKSYAFGESRQKKTPFVSFACGFTGWPEDIDEDQRLDSEGKPFDLTKKNPIVTFYLSDDAQIRYAEFVKLALPDDVEHETLDILTPKLVGTHVIITVSQRMNEETNTYFNDFQSMVPAE